MSTVQFPFPFVSSILYTLHNSVASKTAIYNVYGGILYICLLDVISPSIIGIKPKTKTHFITQQRAEYHVNLSN